VALEAGGKGAATYSLMKGDIGPLTCEVRWGWAHVSQRILVDGATAHQRALLEAKPQRGQAQVARGGS
jgi:hypothetical protein